MALNKSYWEEDEVEVDRAVDRSLEAIPTHEDIEEDVIIVLDREARIDIIDIIIALIHQVLEDPTVQDDKLHLFLVCLL